MALTLRTLGGLSTEEIALAFLVPSETMSKRLTRANYKIRDADLHLHRPRDWQQIAVLYDTLVRQTGSAIVELKRARPASPWRTVRAVHAVKRCEGVHAPEPYGKRSAGTC